MVLTGKHVTLNSYNFAEYLLELLTFGKKSTRFITYLTGMIGIVVWLILVLPFYFLIIHPLLYRLVKNQVFLLPKITNSFLEVLDDEKSLKEITKKGKKNVYKTYRLYHDLRIRYEGLINLDSARQPFFTQPLIKLIKELVESIENFESKIGEKIFFKTPEDERSGEIIHPINNFEDFADDWNDESMDVYDVKYGPLCKVD